MRLSMRPEKANYVLSVHYDWREIGLHEGDPVGCGIGTNPRDAWCECTLQM